MDHGAKLKRSHLFRRGLGQSVPVALADLVVVTDKEKQADRAQLKADLQDAEVVAHIAMVSGATRDAWARLAARLARENVRELREMQRDWLRISGQVTERKSTEAGPWVYRVEAGQPLDDWSLGAQVGVTPFGRPEFQGEVTGISGSQIWLRCIDELQEGAEVAVVDAVGGAIPLGGRARVREIVEAVLGDCLVRLTGLAPELDDLDGTHDPHIRRRLTEELARDVGLAKLVSDYARDEQAPGARLSRSSGRSVGG